MEISKQDIIQIDNIKYIVLTSMHYLDSEYFFVNESQALILVNLLGIVIKE